jgi:hypothetical protein
MLSVDMFLFTATVCQIFRTGCDDYHITFCYLTVNDSIDNSHCKIVTKSDLGWSHSKVANDCHPLDGVLKSHILCDYRKTNRNVRVHFSVAKLGFTVCDEKRCNTDKGVPCDEEDPLIVHCEDSRARDITVSLQLRRVHTHSNLEVKDGLFRQIDPTQPKETGRHRGVCFSCSVV